MALFTSIRSYFEKRRFRRVIRLASDSRKMETFYEEHKEITYQEGTYSGPTPYDEEVIQEMKKTL
jgi:hypothetical protein